ncbi:hypothetical protein ACIG3E_33165 [Streptomyces sp. NPDC053474]|uniref:hypothetical protein n=1 Tax=Streptomyces sp. NPDC053474 TaxID=3365704 RepID=UPI0037D19947
MVKARQRWLEQSGLPGDLEPVWSALGDGPGAVVLTEDSQPLGVMRVELAPDLSWWTAEQRAQTSVLISAACTLPGRSDRPGRLLTLWARHYTSCLGRRWVRCEVPSGDELNGRHSSKFAYLMGTCGWQRAGTRTCRGGGSVVMLQTSAEVLPSLPALVASSVPVPAPPADAPAAR